jgi:hypothetical protein
LGEHCLLLLGCPKSFDDIGRAGKEIARLKAICAVGKRLGHLTTEVCPGGYHYKERVIFKVSQLMEVFDSVQHRYFETPVKWLFGTLSEDMDNSPQKFIHLARPHCQQLWVNLSDQIADEIARLTDLAALP